jgi:hypothetical protein
MIAKQFEGFEGDVDGLVSALHRQKKFLETGDPAYGGNDVDLYADSGLLLGIQTAWCLLVLNRFGLGRTIRRAYGCSTGIPPIFYWTRGWVTRGLTIYFRECMTREFLNMRKFASVEPEDHPMGVNFLWDVFLGSTGKGADAASSHALTTQGIAVVTDWETGMPRHIPLDDPAIDPVRAVTASLADPVFSHGHVIIGGRRYCDGNVSAPMGISHVLKHKPKHLLVIANGTERQKRATNRYPDVPALARLPAHIRDAIAAQPDIVARELVLARAAKDTNVVIYWGPEGNPVDRNSTRLRNLGKSSAQLFAAPFSAAANAA